MTTLDQLQRQFDIPGVASVQSGESGLPRVRVTSSSCRGDIYLYGAHVTSWVPAGGQEVLFLSQRARFEPGRAIRGGIPICAPWFGSLAGRPDAPAHGVVRTRVWTLDAVDVVGDDVCVTMSTTSDDVSRTYVPAEFRLVNRVTFGTRLRVDLTVHNTGSTPFAFEQALHSYYRVAAIEHTRVVGFDGVPYLDALEGRRSSTQQGDITFGAEVDRIYLSGPSPVVVEDGVRRLSVEAQDSATTVVWNPWVRKAQALSDLGDEEWREFVCVETCNVAPAAVEVAPGAAHSLGLTVRSSLRGSAPVPYAP